MKNIFSSKLNTILCLIALGLFLVMACQQGPPKNSREAQAVRGKTIYMEKCAPCHGDDAKGNGPQANTLKELPSDLTQINKNRGMKEMPIGDIARMIDGRKLVAGHGTREMPVWGEVFTLEEGLSEGELKGRLGELIAYLMSIQSY